MDATIHDKIEALTRQIQELARKQTLISNEIVQLINELEALKQSVPTTGAAATTTTPVVKTGAVQEVIEAPPSHPTALPPPVTPRPAAPPRAPRSTTTFEEFIGKNVASKVGILVTIIGIFIGAKYAIEHDMVSPALRVIAGYLCGAALTGIAIRLKKKYEAYSSVLMGGGLAVLYFITYIAYSFYDLMPQVAAFALMLVFTAGTVYAALLYNRVIIAHLAQVGAYAIPFLLSDNSGRYAVFFTYIAIINTGILAVSLRKYWKSLFYTAFALTWIIYATWYFFKYGQPQQEWVAWTFLSVFFLLFYATFLAYKIIKKEQYGLHDVAVLLSNAFIFYGIGFGLLNQHPAHAAGLFTIANAAIHLVVSQVIRKLQLADRSLYYLVLGLVIVFCTIAVPVQFDGNWVTLLWMAEAVLVFVIGRTRQAPAYEKLGAGLLTLGFLSLAQDWFQHSLAFTFTTGARVHPFFNIIFASGLLVAAAQGVIIYLNRDPKYQSQLPASGLFRTVYDYILPLFFLITCYFVFQIEIDGYFRQVAGASSFTSFDLYQWRSEVNGMELMALLLYSMVFDIAVIIVNNKWARNRLLAVLSLVAMGILLLVLLTEGLAVLNIRTKEYYTRGGAGLYFGIMNVGIRYIVMAITALLLYFGRLALGNFITSATAYKAWSLMAYTMALGFISAEYLCWTTVAGADNQYKLGLSIIWGVYALGLVVLGIRNKQKHLRLAAIALFVITLVKLFLYDLAGARTITKTISFISLGVILLLVSYLYNRYKEVLFGDDEADKEADNAIQ